MSLSMMLKYSLNQPALALKIDSAVDSVLAQGLRTADIAVAGESSIGTIEITDAIISALA